NWDTDKMIQIFENEPMVAGPQPITDIWINSDQQMQIPAHLFDSEKAGNWLKQFHFVESDYSILENKITEPTEEAPRVVYAVPDEVIYRLDRFFPEANTDSLSAILIQTLLAQKAEGLHLNFLDKRVVIIWIQQGVLKYVQSLNYDSCADVIYLLAELSE